MSYRMVGLTLLSLYFGLPAQASEQFRFASGQSVYVIAIELYGSLENGKPDLEVERRAKEQFAKEKRFKIAKSIRDADFVFVVLRDPTSSDYDEQAFAIDSVSNDAVVSLDDLSRLAGWQAAEHLHSGKEAAKRGFAGATFGAGLLFVRSTSVVKQLVRRFHREVLR